jgi:tetratricopeptide (TPR) repeat protein
MIPHHPGATPAPTAPTEPTVPDAPVDLYTLLRDLQERVRAATQRLSEPQLNSIYSAAYNLLQQGRIDRAVRMFSMLIALRPERARYWHAVGVCRRRQEEFAIAVEAFGRAFELDPAFLDCGLMQVESMLLMQRRSEAAQVLDKVEAMAREHGDGAAMVRTEGLRELIEGPKT